jgi:hypothetical protein
MQDVAAFNVQVLPLRFRLQALQDIHLGPQAGAQLRGALWAALRESACTSPGASPRELAAHSQHCPMCRLMHLETQVGTRGTNPARPFAIRPPMAVHPSGDRLFMAGETFQISIHLFGDALKALGFIAKGMMSMGAMGVGYHRGQFQVVGIEAHNPLTGASQTLLTSPGKLAQPQLSLTATEVHAHLASLNAKRLRLRFITPTLLRAAGDPIEIPTFPILIARLLERCQSLEQTYTAQPGETTLWRERHLSLTTDAAHIRTVAATRWVRVESGSRRICERNAMGGFVGDVVVEGELTPFLEWLVWGSLLHVGKNAVKGSGWYEIN